MNIDLLRLISAVAWKELKQVSRDRLTLALLLGVPLLQLLLFGYAINLNPKALPTAVVAREATTENNGLLDQAISELEATGYFKVVARTADPATAERWMLESRTQFTLVWPSGIMARAMLGERPVLKLIADATDPIASTAALNAASNRLAASTNNGRAPLPFALKIERRFNPDSISALYIVPGLLGVILTLTLTLLAALCVVRELEHGTWEGLIATPLPPLSVLLGKLLPYWALGFIQATIILALAAWLFDVPWLGSVPGLILAGSLFMLANLGLGLVFSLLARNQMQAMQMGIFFYLPSILLSGFMFPFYGMPRWAQLIGEILPLTHFLRVVRGVLLKGADDQIALALAWPIGGFAIVTMTVALLLYRRTLD